MYWQQKKKGKSFGRNVSEGLPSDILLRNINGSFHAKLKFTCSKSTKETLEKGVNYEDQGEFKPFSSVSIADFE